MNNNRLSKTTILFFILASGNALAQDPEYTQFYANPVYTNPAMAGSSKGGRFVNSYRNQWPSLPGSFVTSTSCYDQYFKGLHGGIAFPVTFDKAGGGLLRTNSYSFVYAYEQKLNEKISLRAGIQASYVEKSIDFTKLTFGDMIEPRSGFKFPTGEPLPTDLKSFGNISAGLLVYTEKFFAGFAAHNLNTPNQSFYDDSLNILNELPMRFTLHAGACLPIDNKTDLPLNERTTINPNLLVVVQKEFNQLNIGANISKKFITAGLAFRTTSTNPDAVIGLIGFRFKQKFTLAYSYDLTVSDARTAAVGSHELSFTLKWKSKRSEPKDGRTICPSF